MSEEFRMWVNQNSKHNKWWTYEISGNDVIVKYGRIGLKGQKRVKSFGDSIARDNFIYSKCREKVLKGYRPISVEEYNLLRMQAEIMGSGNKIENIGLVLDRGNILTQIQPEEAYDPTIKPKIFVTFRLRNRDGATEPLMVLFAENGAYAIEVQLAATRRGITEYAVKSRSKITEGHRFHKTTEKLMEAVGMSL